MSERKSAEIKFRCTPSFKSGAQAAADAADQNLTEYFEALHWAAQNAKLDGTALIDKAIALYREIGAEESGAVARLHAESEQALALKGSVPAPFTGTPTPAEEWLTEDTPKFVTERQQPDAVITNVNEACGCRPWEFCTHKASA